MVEAPVRKVSRAGTSPEVQTKTGPSRDNFRSLDSCGLDLSAAKALKQFVKKNKPQGARYASEVNRSYDSEGKDCSKYPSEPTGRKGMDSPSTASPESSPRAGGERPSVPSAGTASGGMLTPTVHSGLASEASTSSLVALKPTLKKFDIFDDLDEDRLAEFEHAFAETRAASNYDDFKKKAKKHDANKYATCSCVDTKDDGKRVLS